MDEFGAIMSREICLTTVLRITDGIALFACWLLVEVRGIFLQVFLGRREGTERRILFPSSRSLPFFLFIVKLSLSFFPLNKVNLDRRIYNKRLNVYLITISNEILYKDFP